MTHGHYAGHLDSPALEKSSYHSTENYSMPYWATVVPSYYDCGMDREVEAHGTG